MNIALCRPPYDAYIITPPLGLGYLSAYLKKYGYFSYIVDPLQSGRLSMEETVAKIGGIGPKMVCIHATTDIVADARVLIACLRKVLSPSPVIVVGGPHPTALPEETLKELRADFVVVGEGEETLLELAREIERNGRNFSCIKGLCFNNEKNEIILTARRPLIENLDHLPFPDWEQINPKFYPDAPHGVYTKSHPIGTILTSRGCPYRCTFCASNTIWLFKFRQRRPQNIVDEVELLIDKYGCKEIHFEDDNFTLIKKNAMAVCDEILRRNLKFNWKCPNGVRIDTLDEELLTRMKASGCYLLALGIESGDQSVLDAAKKNLDLRMVKDKIRLIKKHGIVVHGFFLIGFPEDTYESVMRTINFARTCGLHTAQFNLLCPFPGSDIFDDWRKGHALSGMDWSRFTVHTPLYETKTLKPEQLKSLAKKALIRYYSHPVAFFNFVKHLRLKQVRLMSNILKHFIFSKTKR